MAFNNPRITLFTVITTYNVTIKMGFSIFKIICHGTKGVITDTSYY
ncbi:7082_t:CDS:2 [Funneliformis mosseae]|uniref:7082_t:CDS:1 n=1 Tax=Funneliformis mosseae TaxID=27381 RepID=A0A9N9CJ10_FUNMO|nr:7082_t:CDS:2 [Funneliformis mosseae]